MQQLAPNTEPVLKEIDAVYTWVNGGDPTHQAKMQHYMNSDKGRIKNKAADPTRFSDQNELYYSICLLRQNAPWLNNIFLVTDNQIPVWLKETDLKRLKVKVINHEELFKDHLDALPTFNSRTIELLLHKIEGLSNHYIYLNDDFFVLRPVTQKDFFKSSGTPIYRGFNYATTLTSRVLRKFGFGKAPKGLVGWRAEVSLLNLKKQYFRLAHAPYPVDKATFDVYLNHDLIEQHIHYKFRDKQQIWPYGYYANKAIINNKAQARDMSDIEYISPECSAQIHSILGKILRETTIKFLCIQSLDSFTLEHRKELVTFLMRQVNSQ